MSMKKVQEMHYSLCKWWVYLQLYTQLEEKHNQQIDSNPLGGNDIIPTFTLNKVVIHCSFLGKYELLNSCVFSCV